MLENVSARIYDANGFWQAKNNPITKVGIFPYMGSEIPDAPDPAKVYRVLRPADELGNVECLNSFKLMPFVDEHTVLGPGFTDASEKGVHGVIGEEILFDGEYVRGNLQVFSGAIADAITGGKKELSAGYRCNYDWTAGIFNGEAYDAVQRNIRANHLALVQNGRMGPDVAVLDHRYTFTIDSMEHIKMADEDTNKGGEMAEMKATLAKLAPIMAEFEEIKTTLAALTKAKEEAPAELTDDEKAAAAEKAKAEGAVADNTTAIAAMDARCKALEAQLATALDGANPKVMLAHIQKRDALAQRVTPFIGVFDHAAMTENEVAVYAAEKLGLKPAAGTEVIAIDGYLAGRQASAPAAVVADAAPAGSAIAQYLSGKKE